MNTNKNLRKIGEGRTAFIYADENFAYKVYHEKYPKENSVYECWIQNEVYTHTKLPVLKYELTDEGIKMPLIKGTSFADRIRVEKYKHWLEDFTDLQKEIYQYRTLNLLDSYKTFESQVKASQLDDTLKVAALSSIQSLSDDMCLCHFDFHPLNIMYTKGTYMIIDWTNAKLGHKAMDIASTYIIFRQYLKRQANKYLKMMIAKTNVSLDEIKRAIPMMAFIKLNENSDPTQVESLTNLILEKDKLFEQL